MIDEIMNGMGDIKYSFYQDEEGNVYELKTDLEQKLVKEISRLHSQRKKTITYIQNEIYIDMRKENEWISKYFTKDLVSVSDLLDCIEDLDSEIENLKLEIEELKTPDEDPDDDFMQLAKSRW